jgi:hypothetical protein
LGGNVYIERGFESTLDEGVAQPLGFSRSPQTYEFPFREVKRANALYDIDSEIGPDATADFDCREND